jgi:NAD(P)-dependent dehydrogenase (short-subunit alcohol dehydrogenase family)
MILQDKVALVTGGTSGIGRATAIAYAQQQAKVVVVGRRIDEGEETVRLIQEVGGEAIFVQADVTKEADVKAMIDKAVDVFGRLDIAFNNAGVSGENPSLIEQTEAEYDRTMNINRPLAKVVAGVLWGLNKGDRYPSFINFAYFIG